MSFILINERCHVCEQPIVELSKPTRLDLDYVKPNTPAAVINNQVVEHDINITCPGCGEKLVFVATLRRCVNP